MGDISRMVCYHFINILGHTNITSNININFSNICINYWRLILTDTLLKGGEIIVTHCKERNIAF